MMIRRISATTRTSAAPIIVVQSGARSGVEAMRKTCSMSVL
jgi:hypothetical protein